MSEIESLQSIELNAIEQANTWLERSAGGRNIQFVQFASAYASLALATGNRLARISSPST